MSLKFYPRVLARFIGWLPLFALFCAPLMRADETMRQVQEELRKRDLYFGDIDGNKTPQIAAALRSYQSRKGFSSTGEPDDTTLRSLSLLPALPLAGNLPSTPTPPPGSARWPDITVLRSDEGRHSLVSATVPGGVPPDHAALPPTVLPTPGPPPAGTTRQWTRLDTVRAYLHDYLQAGQTNDTKAEMQFYDEHVDYFNEGVVDRRFIESDVTRYDRRWPQRHFIMLEPLEVADSPDGDPDKFVARFRLAFSNKNSRYAVEGKVDDTFTFHRTGPDSFRIMSMKEQRVREN